MRKVYLLTIILLTSLVGVSQTTVDQTLTIESYVNDILLGSGIQASNITFTGSMIQLGHATGMGDDGFPLVSGLVMSSEDAINIQTDGSFGNIPFGEGISGDADLLTAANSVPPLIGQNFNVSSVNDVCIIEFDFVATGDTMSFNYSFGSDEYLEWVNSSYNDIFGFFLSGPGLTGPFSSPAGFPDGSVNIAEIPDSDPQVPITISSVNDDLNTEYYIDNFNNNDVAIDGYTTKLTAWSQVQCGETYHIKLAIADGSDTALESIVILEEGSFESNSVVEVALTTDVGTFYNDGVIYEDCGIATLTFTRPLETILEVEEMVIINYLGTAINGVDVTLLPDTVFFAPFVEVVEFELDAFTDGLAEGPETVIFEILNIAACNGGGLITYFEFIIDDYPEPLTVEGYDLSICQGVVVELEPIISGGYGNFNFEWSDGNDTFINTVSPDLTTVYNLTVTDTCGMPPADASFEVEVQFFPDLTVVIDQGDFSLDCGESLQLTATAGGGDGVYTDWYWYDEDGNNLWGWQNTLWFSTWAGAEQVNVDVTDGCGITTTTSVNVDLNIPELFVNLDPDLLVWCDENFVIDPDPSGGQEPFWFNWYVDGMWVDWQPTFSYSTDEDVVITVEVNDNCGQQETVDVAVVVQTDPMVVDLPEELFGNCLTDFNLQADISGGATNYSWQVNGAEIGTLETIVVTPGVSTVVELLVSGSCGAFGSDEVILTIENPEVLVEIGEDINASCIDNTDMIVDVISGAGQYQYLWLVDGEDVGATDDVLTWQTYTTSEITVNVTDGCGGMDQDTLMLIIPNIPLDMSVSTDTTICLGGTAWIQALATGGEEGFVYHWTPTDQYGADLVLSPFSSTTFTVSATDICGYVVTDEVIVNVVEQYASFDEVYLTETDVQFTALPQPECTDGCQFFWDFGDGEVSDEANPLHIYDGLSGYDVSLVVINEHGCIDTAYTTIFGPPIIYIPNAFTPNNDGVNDYWKVIADQLLRFEITVFDRWGEVVFASADFSYAWDGSVSGGDYFAPNGVYSYVCKYKGFNSDALEKMGTITLMR
jgi:gliding motility-associated-like protein